MERREIQNKMAAEYWIVSKSELHGVIDRYVPLIKQKVNGPTRTS